MDAAACFHLDNGASLDIVLVCADVNKRFDAIRWRHGQLSLRP
ncbi:MAG: hypothetical protein AB8B87_01165 [Granulosicoccus sp.]